MRLNDQTGRVGWGEIAPLDGFGSESWAAAWDFCQQLPPRIDEDLIFAIPDALPACQFGFESAWKMLHSPSPESMPSIPWSGLLPPGWAAVNNWKILWQQGFRTFKWKIAVAPLAEELEILRQLLQQLPPTSRLRLDPNGGLDQQSLRRWLVACDPQRVEFIEQPFPKDEFESLLALSRYSPIPIALDESVATIPQLIDCYQRGWRGIFVIKPAIAGSPRRLRQFCRQQPLDLVFSSVLEGAIGRQAALQLAQELGNPQRAQGFGVDHWLATEPSENSLLAFEQQWQQR
jgi:o-succinylbenzoate synthase